MNYTVVMTETASQDLRDIVIRIAEQSKDPITAKHFLNELRIQCSKLDTFPYRGAFPKDHILKSMGYRYIVYKCYLIFYLVDEGKKSVNIMAIFNSGKDYMHVLKRIT